jgi:hypothetical protein
MTQTIKIIKRERLKPVIFEDEFRGPCEFCGLAPMGEHCADCRFYIIEFDRLCNACHDKLEEKDKPTVEKLKAFVQKQENE